MIKKLINYANRKRYILENFIENRAYFSNGKYRFDSSLTYIYMKEEYTEKIVKKKFNKTYLNNKYKIINFILEKVIFNKTINFNEHNNKINFNGTLYLPANNNGLNKDAKIFDFYNKKVMSIITDEKKYFSEIENYYYFSKYFNMPKLIYASEKDLVIINELIEYITLDKIKKDEENLIIDYIMKKYYEYFYEVKTKGNYFTKNLQDIEIKYNFVDNIKYKINENLHTIKFPYIRQHGDLWHSNILIDNERKIYIIDWEHSSEYILFYDIFWFIQNEAIYNNNYLYIDNYFKGNYDEYFNSIFELFDLTFDSKYRIDYFSIFYLNVFSQRLYDKDEYTNKVVYNHYENLISNKLC